MTKNEFKMKYSFYRLVLYHEFKNSYPVPSDNVIHWRLFDKLTVNDIVFFDHLESFKRWSNDYNFTHSDLWDKISQKTCKISGLWINPPQLEKLKLSFQHLNVLSNQ